MPWTETEPGAGDPDGLLALAGELEQDADDAAHAAGTLRSIQDQTGDAVWRGSSADAFRDRIDKVPGHLDKLQASYADAAAGLRGYAAAVRQIADDARVQQRLISQSQTDLSQAQTAQAGWVPPPDPVTGHPDPTARNPHDAAVDAAHASVRRAQARLADLADRRRGADRRVVETLRRAHGEGMHNKHWWQRALNAASEVLAKVTIVLMVVALVAIVILAIVQPELIPGLLLLAGQLMTALSAAQLAVDGARKASGEDVSWGSLALDALGTLPLAGKLAATVPLLARGAEAMRGAASVVRGYGTAGSAFVHSLGTDLKATRFVVRAADTGTGLVMMSIAREGKTTGEMLTYAQQKATVVRALARIPVKAEWREVDFYPVREDWGFTEAHLDKHFFGDTRYSLEVIDPGGSIDGWMRNLRELTGRGGVVKRKNGIIDIFGKFQRADGSGHYDLGIRLATRADGKFDFVTVLTIQSPHV